MVSTLNLVAESITGATEIAANVLTPMLRTRRTHWGATHSEIRRYLPGDELVRFPKWNYTHAISINAPSEQVWPWLVQIGQGRAGFYSYEGLENLVGSEIHNTTTILAAFQELNGGDKIQLHPKLPPYAVAAVEPNQFIVLHGDTRKSPLTADYLNVSWLLFLEVCVHNKTRLITRSRSDYGPNWANRLGYGPLLIEPISFVMEKRMMEGIKQRAESAVSWPTMSFDFIH